MDYFGNTIPDDTVINITPRKTFVFEGDAKKISKMTLVAKATSGESVVYVEKDLELAEADYITWDESATSLTILEEVCRNAVADGYATEIATALNSAIGGE
jgi:hypothetical protein